MLLVLAMLMTMFVGVGTASASPYSTSTVPTVSKAAGQSLGPVIIDFPILGAGPHKAVIKLPDSFVIAPQAADRVSDISDTPKPLTGGAAAVSFTFDITTPLAVGETIYINGVAFTANSAANGGAGTFNFNEGSANNGAADLALAINNNTAAIGGWTAADTAPGKVTLTYPGVANPPGAVSVVRAPVPGSPPVGVVTPATEVAMANNTWRLSQLSGNQLQLEINNTAVLSKVKLAVNLNGVTVPSSADAEITATIMKLAGDFTDGFVTVAKTSGGALDIVRSDPGTLTAGLSANIPLHVREDAAGALEQGMSLKLKLPRGVEWNANPTVMLFPGTTPLPAGETITAVVASDRTVVEVTRTTAGGTPAAKYTFTITGQIVIDEEVADFGDINLTVSGKSQTNTSQVKLGTYKDFGYTVKAEKPDTELVAGRANQEISTIEIAENIAGSILAGRQVYMTLSDGVEWSDTTPRTVPGFGAATFSGQSTAGTLNITFKRSTNDLAKVNGPVVNGAAKGKMELKNLEVDVAPDFSGPIEVTFHGSAGITETIKVAEVVAPVEGKADKAQVIIGRQDQKAGDITITETMAEGILATQAAKFGAGNAVLTLRAPQGVQWAKLPKVEVTEGDLNIGTVRRTWDPTSRWHTLEIEIKNASRTASEIKISDVYYTVDRTVAEGDLKIDITGSAVNQSWSNQFINRGAVASVVAATVVTPAPGETIGSGEFRIGSNIYYEGGVAKVMDVAPYIKGDRTYVPMRYLGEILGAEVVWDDAARKVTLNKDEITVEFTIGSTTYTVNGEAKNADVAPEISNDRTMLPARFVAEAFGAVVGWDASTQTVLIQK